MKPQHQVFIIKMIKYGDKVQAYRAAYPKCTNDETARKSAERILRHHPEVAAEIEEAAANIRQRAYAEAYRRHVEQQKTPLLSMMKRREILAQIATCQMKVGRFVKNGDRYIMIFEDPRPRDIMQAMQIDVKMEEACNRMRNCNDPFFSQFNIYIDGRPCDQPHLPPDPNLPPGIYMLPRRRKNQIEGTGIILEQTTTQHCPPPGGDRGALAPEKSLIEEAGIKMEQTTTQHCPPPGGDRGALAPEKNLIEKAGINLEQTMTQHCPPPGGDRRALAPEKNTIEKAGINLEQTMTQHCPPPGGDRGALASKKNLIEKAGINLEQTMTQHCPPPGGDRGALPPEKNTIEEPGINLEQTTTQHCPPPGGDRGADPLAASFYKQEQQARASAPPPHILTPEEVKELDEEYARKRRNEKPVKPSTFGKMYFKEKGIDYDNLE